MQEKLQKLKDYLAETGGVAVAFSGGVDSSFLLKVAHEVLGDRALGVTARSSTYPEREYREAVAFAAQYGIDHVTVISEELDVEGFAQNPVNRCYLCKGELFEKVREEAAKKGIIAVAEGSNMDDLGDFRPGLRAVAEQQVLSPLRVAGLTKDEIRALSREMGLDTWDKPAFACLSSRFPYGETITREKLEMVDKAEQYLMDAGFRHVRVRHHGQVARIELASQDIPRFVASGLQDAVYKAFRDIGFPYVSLDIRGYRTGSMNETLENLNI